MKIIIIIIQILLLGLNLFATGETSGSIFAINPMPVSAGFNLLSYAQATPLESVVYNPAYTVSKDHHLGLSYEKMPLDMHYGSFVYIAPSTFGESTGMGILLKYYNSGRIIKMNESGEEMGDFNVNDLMGSLSMGFHMSKSLQVGIRMNIIHETLDYQKETAYNMDIGAGWDMSLFNAQKMQAGIVLLNIGTRMWDERQSLGLAGGIVLNYPFGISVLEYGIATIFRSGMDYEVGPSIRYSLKIRTSFNKFYLFKIGGGYSYGRSIDKNGFLTGLKTGAFLETPWNIALGYEMVFYPWGNSNKFYLGYRSGFKDLVN
ncbi:MAG: hypothetical protein JW827_05870 [Spirochaetes bacterium]|nr:hypothetical protein [Spirochaetota bacterium]